LLDVQFGKTEFDSVDYQSAMRLKVQDSWIEMIDSVQRSIELQASQVLQTGKLDLPGKDGVTGTYALDYKPKSSHFPTVSTSWSDGASTKIADLDGLAETIRNDGLRDVRNVIMGDTAWKHFINDTDVTAVFKKNEGLNAGTIDPRMMNNGMTYRGNYKMGTYFYDFWTYSARYNALDGSGVTRYLDVNKVIMMPDVADLDFRKVFAGIPQILPNDPRVAGFMPARVNTSDLAFKPRVYPDEKGDSIVTEIKSRPLLIPVSIDMFGCLDTVAP
jgi:hypothetical protein